MGEEEVKMEVGEGAAETEEESGTGGSIECIE